MLTGEGRGGIREGLEGKGGGGRRGDGKAWDGISNCGFDFKVILLRISSCKFIFEISTIMVINYENVMDAWPLLESRIEINYM